MGGVDVDSIFGLRFDPAAQDPAARENQRMRHAVRIDHRQPQIAIVRRGRDPQPRGLLFLPVAPGFGLAVEFDQKAFEAFSKFIAAGQVRPPLGQVQIAGLLRPVGLLRALFGLRSALAAKTNVVAQPLKHFGAPLIN